MTTVFLDAVFKPFLKSSMTRATTDDRSDEFPDGWLPSNHSTYGICERKHAISNTPKEKNHTLKDRQSDGVTTRLRNGKWGASYTKRQCSAGQVSISTEVASPEEKNADHLVHPSGLSTEYYPFKRCQVPVGHSVYSSKFLRRQRARGIRSNRNWESMQSGIFGRLGAGRYRIHNGVWSNVTLINKILIKQK